MATASVSPPTAAGIALRSARGQISITHPHRAYAVTGNPFAVPAILPLLAAAFIGADIAILANADRNVTAGGFLVVTCGLLLIAAVTLRGSLTVTGEGINFERNGKYVTATWKQVTGVVYSPVTGLCLTMTGATQNVPKVNLPGGLHAVNGNVTMPLRMFGDRQYSLIYDLRDHLPQSAIEPALNQAARWNSTLSRAMYAGVVAAMCGGLFAIMFAYTH